MFVTLTLLTTPLLTFPHPPKTLVVNHNPNFFFAPVRFRGHVCIVEIPVERPALVCCRVVQRLQTQVERWVVVRRRADALRKGANGTRGRALGVVFRAVGVGCAGGIETRDGVEEVVEELRRAKRAAERLEFWSVCTPYKVIILTSLTVASISDICKCMIPSFSKPSLSVVLAMTLFPMYTYGCECAVE